MSRINNDWCDMQRLIKEYTAAYLIHREEEENCKVEAADQSTTCCER